MRYMKKYIVMFLCTLFIKSLFPAVAYAALPTTSCQFAAIPAYFYPSNPPKPTDYWGLMTSTLKPSEIVIINPNSGVGAAIDSNYVKVVAATKSKGINNIGYVYSSYGTRNLSTIKAEIDKYITWYGINSIFIDETPSAISADLWQLNYFKDLYSYIKARGGTVMLNPGTIPDERYMSVSDQIVTFESEYSKYLAVSFPSWTKNYPAHRFVHLILSVPDAALSNTITLSKQRNAGYVFATNVSISPWSSMPSFWTTEVSQKCSTTPMPTPTSSPKPTPTPPPSPVTDTIKPVVSITSPKTGAIVRRSSTVTISSTVTDNVGITKLEYYVNNTLKCSSTYVKSCVWSLPSTRGKSYTILVKAYDKAGNLGSATSVVKSAR